MTLRTNTADDFSLVDRSAAYSWLRDALNIYAGQNRRYSVKQLARGSGVKDRVTDCAKAQVGSEHWRAMPFEAILSIAAFIGADFTSELIEHIKQGAFAITDPGDLPPGVIAAENAEDNAIISRAASHGEFDAGERPGLKVVATRMISRGVALRSMAA